MIKAIHVGDCSTGCDECSRICAGSGHPDCIGTPEEQERGDALLEAMTPEEREPYLSGDYE